MYRKSVSPPNDTLRERAQLRALHRCRARAAWLLLIAVGCIALFGLLGAYYLGAFARLEPFDPERDASSDLPASDVSAVASEDPSEKTALPPVPVTEPETAKEMIDEAKRLLEHLVSRYPSQPDAHELKARLHNWMDEDELAVAAWEKCLALDPRYAYAHEGLASVAAKRGDHDTAIALYRKAVSFNPQLTPSRIELAKALLAQGSTEEAVAILQETVALFPKDADAHYQLGVTYQQREEFPQAKRSFETSLALDPAYAAAQIGLARTCLQLGLEDEAQQHQEKYRQLREGEREGSRRRRLQFDDLESTGRDIAELYDDAGRIYLAHGNPAAAEIVWKRAVVLDPKGVKNRQMLAWLHAQQGEPLKAIHELREIAELLSDDYLVELEIARIYARMGRTEDAEPILQQLTQSSSDRADAHAELAKLYLQTDQKFLKAVALARRSVEVAPTAENYVLLAGAYERVQEWEKGAEAMAQAMQLEPQNARYRQMYEAFQLQLQGQQGR